MTEGLDEYGPAIAFRDQEPKLGRPSDYSAELATVICERLVDGESLRTICATEGMPNKATVFKWLAKHAEFHDQYARAREAQAERIFEECIEIADDSASDMKTIGDEVPIMVVDHEHISRSRLRVDTRKWMAGKLAPKRFGEKVALEHTGKGGGPVQFESVTDEQRAAALKAFMAKAKAGSDGAS